MHSSIESAKKDVDVLSIHEWENIFRSARGKNKNKYITKEMLYRDFLDLKKLVQMTISNNKVDTEGNTVNWLKVKCLQYKKCDPNLVGYKYNYAEIIKWEMCR